MHALLCKQSVRFLGGREEEELVEELAENNACDAIYDMYCFNVLPRRSCCSVDSALLVRVGVVRVDSVRAPVLVDSQFLLLGEHLFMEVSIYQKKMLMQLT